MRDTIPAKGMCSGSCDLEILVNNW